MMKKRTFLNCEKALLTVMVQADNPERVIELMQKSLPCGAEAFGMQFCRMKREYRNDETYKKLFSAAGDKPIYVTNYRAGVNEGKSDEMLAEEMVGLARCGATLIDVMADMFDRREGEFTTDPCAVEKQKALIDRLHAEGAEVLMSSHVQKYISAERVLEIALGQESRGADICKIVTRADTVAQQIENMRIIDLLKHNLKVPFLYLSGGECCDLMRLVGGKLGNCMTLCVYEHDALASSVQPLLSRAKAIHDNI